MKVREFVRKRVFIDMKTPDGWITVPVVHKSVVLENGTTVRWSKKGECWSVTHAPRWDSAVATSLNRGAMTTAYERGRLRSDRESYCSFPNFQTRMATMVDAATFLEIVTFLGGK